MLYQPALKQIFSAFFRTHSYIRKKDQDAFSDQYNIPVWRALLYGITDRQLTRSDVSKYLSHGIPDSLCMQICRKSDLLLCNISNYFRKNIPGEFYEYIFNGIRDCMDEQFNPFLKGRLSAAREHKYMNEEEGFLEKIITAFKLCCQVYADRTDSALLIENYQIKNNEKIIGRDKELRQMETCLTNSGYVVLYGEDGIGKTELAKKYLALHRSEYDLIIYVGYQGSVSKTVDAVQIAPDAKNDPDISPDNFRKYKIDIINNYEKTIVFVDDLTVESSVDSFNIEDHISDFSCNFIFASSVDLDKSECDNRIKIDRLDNESLVSIISEWVSIDDRDLILRREDEILGKLGYNTLQIKLALSVKKNSGIPVSQWLSSLDNTGSSIEKLIGFSKLHPVCQQLLKIFSMLPAGLLISDSLARKLFGTTFPYINELCDLGLMSKETYTPNERFYHIHSMIAPQIAKQEMIAKNCKEVITDIGNYARMWATNREFESSVILKSICDNLKGSSDEWTAARSYIMVWLSLHGEKETAQSIFNSSNAKKTLDPDVYLKIGIPDDPENTKIVSKRLNADRKKREKLNNNRKNTVSAANDHTSCENYSDRSADNPAVVFDHDRFSLPVYMNNLWNLLSARDFKTFDVTINAVKYILYSYKSTEIFKAVPQYLPDKTVCDFLIAQTKCNSFNDTDIFKTIKELLGERAEPEGLFGSMTNMRNLFYDAVFMIMLQDFYCYGNKSAVTELSGFIADVYNDLTADTKLMWLTEFIYAAFEDIGDLMRITNFLNEHTSQLIKSHVLSDFYINAVICRFFYDSIYNYNAFKPGKDNAMELYKHINQSFMRTLRDVLTNTDYPLMIVLLCEKYSKVLFLWSYLLSDNAAKEICIDSYYKIWKYADSNLPTVNNAQAYYHDHSSFDTILNTLQKAFETMHDFVTNITHD